MAVATKKRRLTRLGARVYRRQQRLGYRVPPTHNIRNDRRVLLNKIRPPTVRTAERGDRRLERCTNGAIQSVVKGGNGMRWSLSGSIEPRCVTDRMGCRPRDDRNRSEEDSPSSNYTILK